MAGNLVELNKETEKGLELISDRNMHKIMRFLFENYGQNDVKKTMLTRFCTPQALTECINKLEEAEFIDIEARKEPQNVFYIRLTPKGLLFELMDIIETSLAYNGKVDVAKLNIIMADWQKKMAFMKENYPGAAKFFDENKISLGF